MHNSVKNKKKAVRRSFYFSPKNLDLIEFLESNSELSPNEFLIEIIRNAKDNSQKQIHDDMTNEELYHKLESLISNLKVVKNVDIIEKTKDEQVETTTPNNEIPVFSKQFLSDMDEL